MPKLSKLQQLAGLCGQSFAAASPPQQRLFIADGWELLAYARRHRVQGLCAQGLQQLGANLPAAVSAAFEAERRALAAEGLRALAASRELAGRFGEVGLPLLFLKGLTVGQLAYRDPFLKMASDVDILVPAGDLPVAAQLLLQLGYTPLVPPSAEAVVPWHRRSKESVWVRYGGPPVELHSRLVDNPAMLDQLDPFAAAPRQVEVARGVRLATLGAPELYAYLAVHGASSAWFRLKWLADFAALLAGKAPEEVDELHRQACALGAGRASAWALLLTQEVFGIAGASVAGWKLRENRGNRRLLAIGLAELTDEAEPTEQLLGTWRIHLAQLLLKPGVTFAAREAWRQAGALARSA